MLMHEDKDSNLSTVIVLTIPDDGASWYLIRGRLSASRRLVDSAHEEVEGQTIFLSCEGVSMKSSQITRLLEEVSQLSALGVDENDAGAELDSSSEADPTPQIGDPQVEPADDRLSDFLKGMQ